MERRQDNFNKTEVDQLPSQRITRHRPAFNSTSLSRQRSSKVDQLLTRKILEDISHRSKEEVTHSALKRQVDTSLKIKKKSPHTTRRLLSRRKVYIQREDCYKEEKSRRYQGIQNLFAFLWKTVNFIT